MVHSVTAARTRLRPKMLMYDAYTNGPIVFTLTAAPPTALMVGKPAPPAKIESPPGTHAEAARGTMELVRARRALATCLRCSAVLEVPVTPSRPLPTSDSSLSSSEDQFLSRQLGCV